MVSMFLAIVFGGVICFALALCLAFVVRLMFMGAYALILSVSPKPPPTSIPSDGQLYPEPPTLLRRLIEYLRPSPPPAPACDRHIADEHMHMPLLAYLYCPRCKQRHIDVGVWAVKKHHTHLCEHCGFRFRVEPYCIGAAGSIGIPVGGPYRGQS